MGIYTDKVVNIALAEVGYKEGSNNWNKYAQELDKINFYNTKKQNVAWCSVFVDYCVYVASGKSKSATLSALYEPTKDNCGAGAYYSAQYFKNKKAFYSSPKVGDKIFFYVNGKIGHTGIVYKVTSSYVYTIEGNKSNMVKKCSYKLSNSSIAGYGRIKYTASEEPKQQTELPKEETIITPVETGTKYTVKTNTGDTLRIRQNATTSSKQVGSIPNKKSFTSSTVIKGQLVGGCNLWVKATCGGVTGYVSGKYLTPTPTITELKEEPVKATYENYKVKTNSGCGLRIRSTPSTKGVQVGLIPNGTTVKVYSTSNGWCYLEYKGVKGYSSAQYLKKV